MGSNQAMNKLIEMKTMGFQISWNLISVGLWGKEEIPPSITRQDVIEYLDCVLFDDKNEKIDDAISLYVEKDNLENFDRLLRNLSNREIVDSTIVKRKWRAVLLTDMLKNVYEDPLQGVLELMEFWEFSMKHPPDCPQPFPKKESEIQKYFTKASYEAMIFKNKKWLEDEVSSIIKSDE